MATLFDQLVAECGLSPLFAERAMERALQRVGLARPRALTQLELANALQEIRKTIAPFLEERVDEVMERVTRLAT